MNRTTFYSIKDEFKFGKYNGTSLQEVIEKHPGYMVWCLNNIGRLRLSENLIEEILDKYPSFPGNDLLYSCVLDEPEEDYYEEEHYSAYDEEPQHYEEYAGTYVQDEMGWSDEMIDTVLDGDPDAYWNID